MHLIDTGGPGGAETVFLETATGLPATQFRSVSAVSRDGWLADSLRSRGHAPLIVPASGSFNLSYLRRLLAITKEHRVDVIAAHLYGSAIYAGLVSAISRVPVVAILHGQHDIVDAGRLSGLKQRIVGRMTKQFVFVSAKLCEEISDTLRAPAQHCRVIPNGIDLGRFGGGPDDALRSELGLSPDTILVGAVGNIRKPKSYDIFLNAAAQLAQRSSRYHFVIAGEGSGSLYEKLLNLRAALCLQNRVTFLGLRTDIPSLLRGLDVYALSSTTEGFSIACVEAMASGIPVVATRSGGPQEIIEDGRSGLLVPTEDPPALAEAIHRVAFDPLLAERLKQGGRERVEQRYSLERMLSSYADLYLAAATSRA